MTGFQQHFLPPKKKNTRKATTRACNELWMRCWEDYQENHRTNNKHASWPHCPCVSEVWGSERRIAPAAYWVSWADALHMMQRRLPEVADAIIQRLVHVPELGGCLHELKSVGNALDHHGFVSRPGWIQLSMGARPLPMQTVEPGEWPHGWQYYASSASEHHFRGTVMLNQTCAANQAHLRLRVWVVTGVARVPLQPRVQSASASLPCTVLERLRLPLHVAEACCECFMRCWIVRSDTAQRAPVQAG